MTQDHSISARDSRAESDIPAPPDVLPPQLDVLPAPPPVIGERFGDHTERLTEYAQWLAGQGTSRGLIGPREVPRLWDRHILNSVALSELLPYRTRVVDIGTGAGLPGLALACVRPDLTVDLVESLKRRTDFLSEVVADLELGGQVRVIRGRAEDATTVDAVGSTPFVTARAVAPLDRLVRWSFPLLSPGGSLLALKGDTAESELQEHRSFLKQMHAEVVGVVECGVGWMFPPTRVVHLIRH